MNKQKRCLEDHSKAELVRIISRMQDEAFVEECKAGKLKETIKLLKDKLEVLIGGKCRCGKPFPSVNYEEVPFEYCSQACKSKDNWRN